MSVTPSVRAGMLRYVRYTVCLSVPAGMLHYVRYTVCLSVTAGLLGYVRYTVCPYRYVAVCQIHCLYLPVCCGMSDTLCACLYLPVCCGMSDTISVLAGMLRYVR